ncbi:protein mono-ADP-ribosyltransferase TIPARP-like isoform X2 [Megalops cyprinoides]|nr:protein mono-ADP-ribosyltransferase TIPARP-like isoform X2 [Megalops cyprinoides]
MEKASGPLPKPAESMEQIHEEPSPDLTAGSGEFAEPVGLPDRIPLVKPYLKKKLIQRKVDTKCLRALDTILTSLLGSDTLVGGDGVFVPQTPLRVQRHLCSAAGQKLPRRRRTCSRSEATTSGLLSGDRHRSVASQLCSSGLSKGDEQPLHGGCGTVAVANARHLSSPGGEVTVTRGGVRETAEAPQTDASCPGDGLFQGKSEEASLDLVFDLLTQLQYHTHQADAVPICMDFLRGACAYGSDCAHHHTVLPYHWQIRRADTAVWHSVSDDSQDQLERLYCNPDNEDVRLKYQGRVFMLDFSTMQVRDLEFDQVRRLSTPSLTTTAPPDANPAASYHTVWKYYCKDNLGWREYSEPVVRLIEEASGRGLKEVRFVTHQNQYVLNIRDGFQQNGVFGFRRQIRKRPLFLSSVLLTPYLRTLGGLCSTESSSSPPPSPMALAPRTALPPPATPAFPATPRVFPETWLPMGSCQDFVQVPVSSEDRSYRTVYSLFHRTVSETRFRILKILRVQNPFLWEKYKRKKEYMSRRMTEAERGLNERHLFHGTSQDAVDGICKHNFDPRVCGKHATMFGQGSYFARKAIYSHNFSRRSPKGVHYMFLAKVLTGRFTLGNPSMRRPPALRLGDPSSDLFDSCVDNWVDPQIFVIFNDDQTYPYFIIQYEEVSNTVSV